MFLLFKHIIHVCLTPTILRLKTCHCALPQDRFEIFVYYVKNTYVVLCFNRLSNDSVTIHTYTHDRKKIIITSFRGTEKNKILRRSEYEDLYVILKRTLTIRPKDLALKTGKYPL